MSSPPSASSSRTPDDRAIERLAAEWAARREFGLSPEEDAELATWLLTSSRHREIFAELQRTSAILDRWPEANGRASLRKAARPASGTSASPTYRLALAGGLAAALMLGIGLLRRAHPSDPQNYRTTAATEVGGFQNLALPDGSTVTLNTDSSLEARFSAAARRVRLERGEAVFSVAPEPGRPFLVEAAGVTVRAVGTIFQVRLRPEAVEVLVTEGSVRVDDDTGSASLLDLPQDSAPGRAEPVPVLAAGQAVSVARAMPNRAPVRALAPAQLEQALAWQERRLKFEATPLGEVVAEFNRYNRRQLVIEDAGLAARRFGGTFRPDGHETLISLLEQSFDVVAERSPHTTVLRPRTAAR